MAQMYFPELELIERGIRLPSIAHENRNGFRPLNVDPGPVIEPESDANPSFAALDAHRLAQYILTQKDRHIPTLKQMQEELKQDATKESIKQRITDLQAQHLSDIQRMYTWHAEEYLEDAHDMYLSLDDSLYPPKHQDDNKNGLPECQKDVQDFYAESRRYIPQQMRWEDELEQLRYSHLELILPLYKELKDVEQREEDERKRREADFPVSVADYNSKSKEVQMRVAKFLMSTDEVRREKMLTEFGWASRQVKPLQDIYKKDDAFKSHVVVQMINFK
ncbi:hypothetical protein H0H87_012912 [Tephrocybe sp. NHM501043]|nr:hypothetical protein H0H87_012912 [Tephrocybe sp. NHM501043]